MLLFVVNLLILGWIGGESVDQPYYFIGQMATFIYFLFFVFFLFSSTIEQYVLKFYYYLFK